MMISPKNDKEQSTQSVKQKDNTTNDNKYNKLKGIFLEVKIDKLKISFY